MTNTKYSIVIYQVNKEIKATFYYKGNLQTGFCFLIDSFGYHDGIKYSCYCDFNLTTTELILL